jgi:hypothetical protein
MQRLLYHSTLRCATSIFGKVFLDILKLIACFSGQGKELALFIYAGTHNMAYDIIER